MTSEIDQEAIDNVVNQFAEICSKIEPSKAQSLETALSALSNDGAFLVSMITEVAAARKIPDKCWEKIEEAILLVLELIRYIVETEEIDSLQITRYTFRIGLKIVQIIECLDSD